ncbi:MFS transporter [Parachryseolinea silvisoli]|uniref:MFS transporter n=1 Tax=Parachryseolinea silvisoli TaxID=2873601 RepID=UPI002265C17B|nr:MFS transporter [Parachryseolinea silvisoli]MCD9016625.1 MFS transporter [Parachryseolinea silvisoli]
MDNIMTQERAGTGKIGMLLWISFTLCLLSNVAAGLISTLMSVYLPVVVKDLSGQVTGDEFNHISAYINSLYIAGWAAGGFMWGWISDRIGRVKSLALSVGVYGIFTMLISSAPSWELVVVFRLLSGFAAGGILVITPTLLFEIWPERTRAVMIGIDSIGFPIGIFSAGLVNYLVKDWRMAFLLGALPITVAILSLLLVKESEHWKQSKSPTGALRLRPTPADHSNLFKGAAIFGSMLVGLWGMFSWIPTWVQSLLTTSTGQAERGMAMMLLGAGGLTGGFISGWVCNRLGVRRAMMLCFAGCIILSGILFGLNKTFSPVIYAELAALSLFFGISQGLLSIYIPQLFPVHIRGTYTGICFNIGRIVTAIAIFFVGVFVSALHGYGNTLLAFAGIFILGFVTLFFFP